ncbi:four helix bundle protein [Pedobacter alpinus]|uniref:Four helix bundle protein n=1 Tax=Pedobacter alpinus TaxID=1590643 RepID=A0ABW5TV40_9SPHI
MLNLSHKKLEVFKESKLLCKEIYLICKLLPAEEKYNLSQQLKRAAISVCSNLAEGSSRKSLVERKRYYEMSRGSIVEIDTQIELAILLKFITEPDILQLTSHVISTFKMLTGMINKE